MLKKINPTGYHYRCWCGKHGTPSLMVLQCGAEQRWKVRAKSQKRNQWRMMVNSRKKCSNYGPGPVIAHQLLPNWPNALLLLSPSLNFTRVRSEMTHLDQTYLYCAVERFMQSVVFYLEQRLSSLSKTCRMVHDSSIYTKIVISTATEFTNLQLLQAVFQTARGANI